MIQTRLTLIRRFTKRVPGVLALGLALLISERPMQAQSQNSAGQIVKMSDGTEVAPQVVIENYTFTPTSVIVKAGTTVTWINHDDDPHTVDSTQGKFKSATLNKGSSFGFRFTEPGEYSFICRFHPKMAGKVIVQR